MSFGAGGYLYLLILILPLVVILAGDYRRYREGIKKIYGNLESRQVDKSLNKIRLRKNFLTAIIFTLLILTLAAPQIGESKKEIRRKVIDVIIAVDCSKSMLAEDIYPSRMAKAKEMLSYLIDTLKGNRIGIIAFSGLAFTQCPLTFDSNAAKLMLNLIDTELIPLGGTNIAEAINHSIKSFPKDSNTTKVLIILTDGEETVKGASLTAQKAKSSGITIFTIGIGTARGEPIPIKDASGKIVDYKKNSKGEVVISALNEELLKDISHQTGGKYFSLQDMDINIVENIAAEISSMEKKEVKGGLYSLNEHRFQYFLFFAIMLLVFEMFLPQIYFYLKRLKL